MLISSIASQHGCTQTLCALALLSLTVELTLLTGWILTASTSVMDSIAQW